MTSIHDSVRMMGRFTNLLGILFFFMVVWFSTGLCAAITKDDETLRAELMEEFGENLKIYKDGQGRKCLGVGHIIKSHETEYKLNIGTNVTQKVCEDKFNLDLMVCLLMGRSSMVFKSFGELPEEVQRLVVMLMFDMLFSDFLKNFTTFRSAIDEEDWSRAAEILENHPIWSTANPDLARKLASRLRQLLPPPPTTDDVGSGDELDPGFGVSGSGC